MKLGHRCKDHNQQAALRHYTAKQPAYDLCVSNPISCLLTMALSTLCKFQNFAKVRYLLYYTSSKGNWMPPHTGSLQLEHTRDDAHCAHNMTLCAQATGTHTRYTANIGAAVTITITHSAVLHKYMSVFSICNN